MKYCIDYRRNFRYLDKIDEITINFNRYDTSLLDFLLSHKDKRINIFIKDTEDFIESRSIRIFDSIAIEHPEINFVFKLRNYEDERVKDLVEIIQDRTMRHKYFFMTYIRDWDTLLGYIQLKPSDIYIVENLGFEIAAVADLLHSKNIRVRVFPNVAQSAWKNTPSLLKFFIRPDDVPIYEPFVDTMEFFGNGESLETYYRIYAIDKKWTGKLNEVIIDFKDSDIDGRYIIPVFASRRVNCGKRCLKGIGCNVCNVIERLSEILEKNNLVVRHFKAIGN